MLYLKIKKKTTRRKRSYIEGFESKKEERKQSKKEVSYSEIIKEIADELNEEFPPSIRTLMRWKSEYVLSNNNIRSLSDNYSNSGRRSALNKKQEELIEQSINSVYLQPEKGTVSQTLEELKILVEMHNRENEDTPEKHILCPSRFQLQKSIDEIDFYTKLEKREGKKEAKRKTRTSKYNKRPDKVLEIGEVDHTILDYYVLDDELLLPLGRPWMTNILELFSRIPLGSDITFNNGSYITIGNALKMSILPKSIFYKQYPDIKNTTNYSGILEMLRTDNGKDFLSSDLDDAACELGMNLHHVQALKSWQKGAIEGFFRKQNVKLIDTLQGKTFRNILEKNKYNPEKESIITLSDFKRILYKWLYDVYPFSEIRIEHGKKVIPHKVWEREIINHPQDFVEKSQLDIIFGIGRQRVAREGGIEINCLKYDNNGLAKFRAIHGEKEKLHIKFHPSNLGYIDVLDPHKNEFFRVTAIDQSYADKLTLHQHNMIKKYVKEEMRQSEDDVKRLMDGKIQLREMVNDCLENNPKALKGRRGAKIREGGFTSQPPNSSPMQDHDKNRPENNSPHIIDVPRNEVIRKEGGDDNWDGSNIEWD